MSRLKTFIVAAVVVLVGSASWAQTFRSLYSFPSDSSSGQEPFATLTVGPDGNLYGTAIKGGAEDAGTAFKVSIASETVSILGHFDGETTGSRPFGRLLNLGDDFLYGVSEKSSYTRTDWGGTVYRVNPNGGIQQIYQLPAEAPDELNPIPSNPRALVSTEDNVLQVLCADYPGLWQVPLGGGEAHVAYSFAADDIDGGHARTIIQGSDGYLYGTTIGSSDAGDAPRGRGTIFRMNPDGTGMTLLHDCQYASGTRPHGALVEGPDGNFYGVMRAGALKPSGGGGAGCVYRITPTGDYTALYHFGTGANDLRAPYGDLLLASDGLLYGTTREGGASTLGGVFRIQTNGSGYRVLHSFNDANGAYPEGGLVQAANGDLYGTTTLGGSGGNGTIFKLKLNLPAPPANRSPVAVDDVGVSTGSPVVIPVLTNDFDPDGDVLKVTILNAPEKGTAVVQPGGTILYTPGGSFTGTDSFKYTISDERGGTASATVYIRATEPGPLVRSGVHNGLLMLDAELNGEGVVPRAQFLIAVQSSGQFTGVLFTERKRLKLRGSFSSNGIAVVNLKLPKKRAAALFLSFQSGEPNTIVGALFSNQERWFGIAGPVKEASPMSTESYTVVLESMSAPVAGFGYGVARIRSNGLVAVVGKLGDGSKLSWGTTLISIPRNQTAIPVFNEPLKGGVCGGYLTQKSGPGPNFAGAVQWVRAATKLTKPYGAGFSGTANVAVAPFYPTSLATEVLDVPEGAVSLVDRSGLEFDGGTFSVDGKKIRTQGALQALSFNRKSGLFAGKVRKGNKNYSFKGAVIQTLNAGAGQYKGGAETEGIMVEAER